VAFIGAAVDVGSNSVHMLVASVKENEGETARLRPIDDRSELLGLGDVVDRTGEIPEEARRQVVAALIGYRVLALQFGAQRISLTGTEPLRRASNAQVLLDEVDAAIGERLLVLSVEEEAELTFLGATAGNLPAEPLLVVDIGGGSTEIGIFVPGRPFEVVALPIGSARLTNSIVEHDPPTDDELDRLHAEVEGMRRRLPPRPIAVGSAGPRAVFVGGTATNVARLNRLTRAGVATDRGLLHSLTAEQISARFDVRPRRARQLAAGAAIVDVLLEHFELQEAEVSDASLRDGVIVAEGRFGDAWPDYLAEMLSQARSGSSAADSA
jgi:exopolyphosphatase/guanosine-5'-triphosphate,3'-diphosphate pyrophosphatase